MTPKTRKQAAEEFFGTGEVAKTEVQTPSAHVWVVYGKIPKALTALCAKKTGLTQQECYEILLPISKEQGVPGLEKQVYEVWGITREEWKEILPLYENASKPVAKTVATPKHYEMPEEEDLDPVTDAQLEIILAKIGLDPSMVEIVHAEAVIKEQTILLEEAKKDLGAARKVLEEAQEKASKELWENANWRALSTKYGNAEWDALRKQAVEAKIRVENPEVYALFDDALLNVAQIEAEIEAAEITIDNLSETEE